MEAGPWQSEQRGETENYLRVKGELSEGERGEKSETTTERIYRLRAVFLLTELAVGANQSGSREGSDSMIKPHQLSVVVHLDAACQPPYMYGLYIPCSATGLCQRRCNQHEGAFGQRALLSLQLLWVF